jgi:two-component system, NarL family, response regulator LiaR
VAENVRVVVVDDHDLFRRGLRELLAEQGLEVVGEAGDGDDGVRLAAHARPDVVLMDLNMPGMSGAEATRRLAELAPEVKVLIFTISAEDDAVMDAIEAGATGYMLKDASIEQITSAVRATAAGESPIAPNVAGPLLHRLRPPGGGQGAPARELTERELDVLRLVAAGKENREIAGELSISEPTVKNHVSSILAKLELDNRIQAAVYAVRNGLA